MKTFEEFGGDGKGPKGKDLSTFVRFGGMDLKNQVGYSNNPKSFHSPPAPRGFYAFPKIAQEMFLVWGLPYQKHTNAEIRNQEKQKDWTEEDYDKRNKRTKERMINARREFVKRKGDIWHHLEEYTDRNEIIDTHSSWVKTSIKAWMDAFNRMSLKSRLPTPSDFSHKSLLTNNINSTRGITGFFSKDHCEVFFDEKC